MSRGASGAMHDSDVPPVDAQVSVIALQATSHAPQVDVLERSASQPLDASWSQSACPGLQLVMMQRPLTQAVPAVPVGSPHFVSQSPQ